VIGKAQSAALATHVMHAGEARFIREDRRGGGTEQ
jgi:hypothetical protein